MSKTMAYLEEYAERVRLALATVPNITEQKMFGSLGFMVNGHLTIGIGDGEDGTVIMVRVGKEAEAEYLRKPGTSISVMGKKAMHGWIDLTPAAVNTEDQLEAWVQNALDYVYTLPPKKK